MNAQENQQLIIKDSGLLYRIVGLIGALVAGGIMIFRPSQTKIDNISEMAFVIFGALMVLFYATLVITADRSARTLKLDYRYLLFHSVRSIPFDEIEGIRAEKRTSTRNGSSSTGYRIVATLKNGKHVPFRIAYISGNGKTRQQQAAHLNTFINHKTPAATI